MKKLVIIIAVALISSVSYAQEKEDIIGLNEETNLIEAVYFHENGKVSQTGTFNREGKLHGEWISFNEAGEKISKGSYINGRKAGKWMFWVGENIKEVRYSDNAIASVDGVKKDGLVKN